MHLTRVPRFAAETYTIVYFSYVSSSIRLEVHDKYMIGYTTCVSTRVSKKLLVRTSSSDTQPKYMIVLASCVFEMLLIRRSFRDTSIDTRACILVVYLIFFPRGHGRDIHD